MDRWMNEPVIYKEIKIVPHVRKGLNCERDVVKLKT